MPIIILLILILLFVAHFQRRWFKMSEQESIDNTKLNHQMDFNCWSIFRMTSKEVFVSVINFILFGNVIKNEYLRLEKTENNEKNSKTKNDR